MCTYCGTKNYHKIYLNHYGPIPREPNGRTYEIHHIDGNHSNNDPGNLVAVTLQEHYDIHYAQGDYGACYFMMVERMNRTPEEISKIASKQQLARVANDTHHLLGGKIQRKLVKDGTHHLLGPSVNNKRLAEGTHHFLDSEKQRKNQIKRVKEGTHHLLGSQHAYDRLANGTHPSQCKISCLHCKKVTDLSHFNKYHRDNCKQSVQSNT
jgi:hypothetical protein